MVKEMPGSVASGTLCITVVRRDCIELNLPEEDRVMNDTAAPDNSYVKKFRLDLHVCSAAF